MHMYMIYTSTFYITYYSNDTNLGFIHVSSYFERYIMNERTSNFAEYLFDITRGVIGARDVRVAQQIQPSFDIDLTF